jgi:carboxypeptidase family protein
MPRNRVRFLSFLALVVLVIQAPMYAQLTAQLTGGIRDASGAVVPGASIVVVNEGTGIKWEAKSNQDGIFTVPLLQPGNYRVSVQAPGFRAVSRTGIQLEVAQTAAMDFTLDVGAATESITVTDSAPLLDSGSNAIGGLVTSEKVEDVPLLGRNSNALVTLVPGVRATRQTTVNPVLESHYQFFSINGSRPNQNQFMLDGGNNTNLTFNGPEYSPQVEEVQEFRIQTSSFSAEYANSGGGVINVVSKGGTNRFHGSLFEYFRHDKLTANDFFSNRSGRLRPQLRYNQFGATFGGPIVKNRTFFFFAYESLRQGIPVPATTSVPTPLQRTGDFSQTLAGNGQLVAIFNPWSTAPNPNSPGQFLREPFPGNRIPQSLIDPVAAKLETFYPSATTAGDPRTQLNNFFSSYPANRSTDNYSGRVDHQLNTSTMLMGRFSRANLSTWANPATFGASNIASPGFSAKPQHHPYALGKVTRTFTPTLFGEFLVSWARWLYVSYGLSNGYDPAKLGLPASLTLNSPVLGFPVFAPGEMSSLGGYSQALDISDRFEGKALASTTRMYMEIRPARTLLTRDLRRARTL